MRRPAALVALLLGTGCTPEWFSDDIDLIYDFAVALSPLRSKTDMLQTPYVRGADVTLTAHTLRERSRADWSLEVDDPSVFTVEAEGFDPDSNAISVNGIASGVGVTDLLLVDDRGRVRSRAPIEVAMPDRVALHASAALFVDHPDLDPLTEAPKVLVDGLATYQIAYYADERRLHGNGVLTIEAPPDLEVSTARTHLFETREWIRLSPRAAGEHTLTLGVGGEPFTDVTVRGVTDDEIASVALYGRSDVGAESGEWLVVAAQAFDAPGDPVHGVAFAWEVHGAPESGEGDLYRYEYDPEGETTVLADFDGLVAEATIFAGEGYVDSSNGIGCDSTGGAAPWGLGLALLGLIRRRRAAP